jgi:hypothetical protein
LQTCLRENFPFNLDEREIQRLNWGKPSRRSYNCGAVTPVLQGAGNRPHQVILIEESKHRSSLIDSRQLNWIDNERWMVHTEIDKPRLNERYILQWEW